MSSIKNILKSYHDYTINIDDYESIKNINKGNFGIITLVRCKKDGQIYVAKTSINNSQNTLFSQREIDILFQIQHPTIIGFHGFSYVDFDRESNLTFIIDYMEEGSLDVLLNKMEKGIAPLQFDNTKRQIILAGIARGMMILHSNFVIHRDLKPENVLLDSDYHPYITDFGMSKFYDPKYSMSQSMINSGTPAYMAPEIFESNRFNTKVDVYAFGILMYEVINNKRAYQDLFKNGMLNSIIQLQRKVEKGLRPIFDLPIKKNLKELIESCWSENPKKRPTFEEIFKKLSLSNDDGETEEEVMSYCLDDVDKGEFLDYIDQIKIPTKTKIDTEELKNKLIKMSSEIKSLKAKLFESEQKRISDIEKLFVSYRSVNKPGILGYLKTLEKDSFDRYFVASQSSCDIYSLLVPEFHDIFGTANEKEFFIDFNLQSEISICGVQIFSSNMYFPSSFNIVINRKTVKKVVNASELNRKYGSMIVYFEPIRCQKVSFVKTGKNGDEKTNIFHIKGIELLSNEPQYSKGVFATLIDQNENKNPHKCPVFISASVGDFSQFYLLEQKFNTYTFSYEYSWFQVEFTKGIVFLNGYVLERAEDSMLRNYKIICTDDLSKPESQWTTLIHINERKKNEHEICDIYDFPEQSPPVKYVRLVVTGPTWSNKNDLRFFRFDLFGKYLNL